MKVLICHDGSDRAQTAMEKAIAILKPVNPEVVVLTVTEPPIDATSHDEEAYEEWEQARNADLKQACSWVAGQGLNPTCILATGDPRVMILNAIKKKSPDLVVVARRGGGIIPGMHLGSVSAYLVRHADCPILVMH
ncbi:MAG: universal stress protein [Nitrospirota bacterium]|nr:universal stress protein [Nitrospirota bacterium]